MPPRTHLTDKKIGTIHLSRRWYPKVILLVIGIILGSTISLTSAIFAERKTSSQPDLPLEDLQIFTEIFSRVKTDYVEEVEDHTLLINAIHGLLTGLDPHSSYLDADAFDEMQISTSGKFGGLGIEVQMHDGFIRVVAPIDDTPAYFAGILAGDLIIRIDGQSVKGMSLNDAVQLMRGEPGSEITLTIAREGTNTLQNILITRAIIKVKSVRADLLEPGFVYFRISQFREETHKELQAKIKEWQQKEKPIRGIVLDLRNNPGGLLDSAIDVSDTFLDKGMIVYTNGRRADAKVEFRAKKGDDLKGAPIVLLVNEGSASASEIVAGALQDNKRALLAGKQTFGKGSVQTLVPLRSGDALKLTTGRYYTPNGRSIQAEGIQPDIILHSSVTIDRDQTNNPVKRLREADYVGRLDNDNDQTEGEDKSSEEQSQESRKRALELAELDYALYEALNLLKGLAIGRDYVWSD